MLGAESVLNLFRPKSKFRKNNALLFVCSAFFIVYGLSVEMNAHSHAINLNK